MYHRNAYGEAAFKQYAFQINLNPIIKAQYFRFSATYASQTQTHLRIGAVVF